MGQDKSEMCPCESVKSPTGPALTPHHAPPICEPPTDGGPRKRRTAEARHGALVHRDASLVQLDRHEVARLNAEQHINAHHRHRDLQREGGKAQKGHYRYVRDNQDTVR